MNPFKNHVSSTRGSAQLDARLDPGCDFAAMILLFPHNTDIEKKLHVHPGSNAVGEACSDVEVSA